jgi:hypothetical protein
MEKRTAQAQAWLRHSQLTTTMNVYTHLDDDGLGGAEAFDEILGAGTAWDLAATGTQTSRRVHLGSTGHPETPANEAPTETGETASQSQISEQQETPANA